jgi:phosphoglycolate phosphatase
MTETKSGDNCIAIPLPSRFPPGVIQAAIFDLDGTLVESLPGIAAGLNRALAAHGHPIHPEETVRAFIGDGAWMLARRAIPDAPDPEVDRVEAAFKQEYANTWQDGTFLFDGILPLLDHLVTTGIPLAVLSNKPHDFTVGIVRHLFPAGSFRAVLGQRHDTPKKPDPAGPLAIAAQLAVPPATIAVIGDSTVDFETAVHAGMQPVLVDWGYHTRDALLATGAPVLSNPDDLRDHLAAQLPTS